MARAALGSHANVEIRKVDFLSMPDETFDFIIGNPPYVPITELTEHEKGDFRARYDTARGRFDLYLLFFEQALECLKPGGRLVFITPEKFLYVETATSLRRLLNQVQVEEIYFADEQAFGELVTYPTITTVVKRLPTQPTRVVLRDGKELHFRTNGTADSWMPYVRGFKQSETEQPRLRDICDRISCGVATGADSVFIIDARNLDPRLAPFARPTIAGRELNQPNNVGKPNHVMLIPYTAEGKLIDEGSLGALRDYLSQQHRRDRLLRRTCVRRKPWYAFHETPVLDHILRPKILCKDITATPHFWIDREGDLVPRHSVYYMTPTDISILHGLFDYLKCDTVAEWLRAHCQHAANGFLRLQSNVLKNLPVPREFVPKDRTVLPKNQTSLELFQQEAFQAVR